MNIHFVLSVMPEVLNRASTLRQAQGDIVMVSLSNHGFPLLNAPTSGQHTAGMTAMHIPNNS